MDYLNVIKKHNWLELFTYAFFAGRCTCLRFYSTFIFIMKCRVLRLECGLDPKIWGKFYIHKFPGSQIIFGNDLRVVSDPYRYGFNIFPQSKIRTFSPSSKVIIGNHVGFNSISIVARSQTISIGDYTMIGGNCQIMDTDGHPLWPPESRWTYQGDEHDSPVTIGNNVFIGLNVTILKGSVIGDNAIIGAGSVVASDVPANCLAAGVPAKVIKTYGNA